MIKTIHFKIIMSVILFTLFIVGLERYQLSKSVTEQFISFKKSKNELLINTIKPLITLNFTLGLDDANKEYLEKIVKQNKDLIYVRLVDRKQKLIYEYDNIKEKEKEKEDRKYSFNHCKKEILDNYTGDYLAELELQFSNIEYQNMRKKNREITLNITLIIIILLMVFVFVLKLMFNNLIELRDTVLAYNPKYNNFPLTISEKKDEVSLIRNAIISMVEKISHYTDMLDKTNTLLEEKVRQRTLQLEESNKELKMLASIDPLTSLYNRRYFTKTSQQVLEISKRNKTAISVLMLDVDNFKNVNDIYGHQVGDNVLVFIASVLMNLTRKSDICCRFGGEEFIILLPDTDERGVFAIAEKIRAAIEQSEIPIQRDKTIKITVSVGVATCNKGIDMNLENIIKRADAAMYVSKGSGKNRISIGE